jgi:ethanolamine utilization protein EutN
MLTARVIGHATSTVKHPSMQGWKLLVVQPLAADGSPDGEPVLAVDRLGAGRRDRVIIGSDGKSTRELIGKMNTPVRWAVLGIQD